MSTVISSTASILDAFKQAIALPPAYLDKPKPAHLTPVQTTFREAFDDLDQISDDGSDADQDQGQNSATALVCKPSESFFDREKLLELQAHFNHLFACQLALVNVLNLTLSGVEMAISPTVILQTSRLLDNQLSRLTKQMDTLKQKGQMPKLSAQDKKRNQEMIHQGQSLQAEIGRQLSKLLKQTPSFTPVIATPTLRRRYL